MDERVKKILTDSLTLALKIPRDEITPEDYYHKQMWVLCELKVALESTAKEECQLSLTF